MGGFVQGVLSREIFPGGFCPRGDFVRGNLSGGFVQRDFVLEPGLIGLKSKSGIAETVDVWKRTMRFIFVWSRGFSLFKVPGGL